MIAQPLIETSINPQHNRKAFDCGNINLNQYFQRCARQNHERGGAKCFVTTAIDSPERALGYYTLSPASLLYDRTPEIVRRGLARYDVPVFQLGRLAVDLSVQGQGIGGRLIMAAGERAVMVAEHVGGVAILIDAKNSRAAEWYRSYGAHPLLDAELSLLLPLETIVEALKASKK